MDVVVKYRVTTACKTFVVDRHKDGKWREANEDKNARDLGGWVGDER